MKFSVITATRNSSATISETVNSLVQQEHDDYEHIIVDSSSTDGTLDLISSLSKDEKVLFFQDEKKGIYDALNIGMNASSGDIICLLHSDDCFFDECVLNKVNKCFESKNIDVVYGNIKYVSRKDSNRVIRNWICGEHTKEKLKNGWMAPHVGIFIKREFIKNIGMQYLSNLRISADYEFILRLFLNKNTRAFYLDDYLVNMKYGGVSNKSLQNLLIKYKEDIFALRHNKLNPFRGLIMKNLRKIRQFF